MGRKWKYKHGSFGELGEVMDRIAWSKAELRGPYNVAEYIRSRTGGGPTGTSMSDYYYEKSRPSVPVMNRFVDTFKCSDEERIELALICTYRFGGGREE